MTARYAAARGPPRLDLGSPGTPPRRSRNQPTPRSHGSAALDRGQLRSRGLAYLFNFHGAFGKRPDGTLATPHVLTLAPFLLFTWSVWHLARLLSREPAISTISPRLRLARRLLPREFPPDIDVVLDLTAEFSATAPVHNYLSLPILDGGVPDAAQLQRTLAAIPTDATTLIHCAQGHGRTALVATCLLIQRSNLDAAAAIVAVLAARPRAKMNRAQRSFVEGAAAHRSRR